MSEIARQATVELALADFAVSDPAGKVNVIGAGIAVVGFDPAQGLSSRFSLWISIHVPTKLCPAEFPVEVALVDAMGELVTLPGPADGTSQPLRIAQVVNVERPHAQLAAATRDHIGSRVEIVLDFSNGLPLAVGGTYEWRVRIDGDDTRTWSYPFAVTGPGQGPVIG